MTTTANRFSFDQVRDVLGGLLGPDLHAKRIDCLSDATLGVLHSGSLAVAAIGHGLAAARGLLTKHAIKQVDRLLSNPGIKIDDILALWVPFVIGARTSIAVAMDWTDFDNGNFGEASALSLMLLVPSLIGALLVIFKTDMFEDVNFKSPKKLRKEALKREAAKA